MRDRNCDTKGHGAQRACDVSDPVENRICYTKGEHQSELPLVKEKKEALSNTNAVIIIIMGRDDLLVRAPDS